jgi:hypothetical protein
MKGTVFSGVTPCTLIEFTELPEERATPASWLEIKL